jgi:prevent-host-death family protein
MRRITVTELRKNLFAVLGEVEAGESVTVTRRGRTVARLVPGTRPDWRANMPPGPRLLVPVNEAFTPVDDWGN